MSLIFVALLFYENILTKKYSQITVTRYKDSRTAKSRKQSRMRYNLPTFKIFFIMQLWKGREVVYWTVLCYRPYLFFLYFAVLLSLHLVTLLILLLLVLTCKVPVINFPMPIPLLPFHPCSPFTYKCTYMYTHTHAHTHTHTHTHTLSLSHTHTHKHTHTCKHIMQFPPLHLLQPG